MLSLLDRTCGNLCGSIPARRAAVISGAWPPPAGRADRCQHLAEGRRPRMDVATPGRSFHGQSGWQVAHRVQTKILVGYELLRIWTDHRKSVVFVTHDIEEAIGLSDRILVMTDRPGRIKSEYRVELPRPRDLRGVRKMPAFHQLSERIWRDIVVGA